MLLQFYTSAKKKKYPLIPNLLKTRWVSELFYDSFTKTPGHWNWRKMKNVSFTLISPNDASLFRTSTFQTRDLKCICHGTDVGPVPWHANNTSTHRIDRCLWRRDPRSLFIEGLSHHKIIFDKHDIRCGVRSLKKVMSGPGVTSKNPYIMAVDLVRRINDRLDAFFC